MKKFVALVITFAIGIIGACAARGPAQYAPPLDLDASALDATWAYQTEGGYAWFVPGRGWVWSTGGATNAPTRHSHPLFAAAAPTTFQYVAPGVDTDHALLVSGAGFIGNIHCVLLSAVSDAGAPLYIMGIDTASSSQPTNGTTPIFGLVSGAMTIAGNDVTFTDTQTPATVTFSNGLMLALSATADTYTAPVAGNQIRCDAKVRGS